MIELDKIYCGDCANLIRQMSEGSVDLTVTSPPYGTLRSYNGYHFDFFSIADQIYRVTKSGGVLVWVIGDETIDGSESGESFKQALYFKSIGFNLHDTMIYEKNGPAHPDKTRYHQVFEYMFVFSRGSPKTINLLQDRKNKWGGSRNFGTRTNRNKNGVIESSTLANRVVKEIGTRFNIWKINNGFGYSTTDNYSYDHPAIFPEALARDHILSWSNAGDVVLDPMCGSGTTLKMARMFNRRYIGFDISEEYVELSRRRVSGVQMELA